MLFMIIEHYGPGIAPLVYRRFRESGRLKFEVIPVRTSAEAAAFIAPQLSCRVSGAAASPAAGGEAT